MFHGFRHHWRRFGPHRIRHSRYAYRQFKRRDRRRDRQFISPREDVQYVCNSTDFFECAEEQVVGITGEGVRPDLYIALGIRGDTMHTWGMKDARYVVAVHPDADAPILKQADAAIVGDPAKWAGELAKLLG